MTIYINNEPVVDIAEVPHLSPAMTAYWILVISEYLSNIHNEEPAEASVPGGVVLYSAPRTPVRDDVMWLLGVRLTLRLRLAQLQEEHEDAYWEAEAESRRSA